MNEIKILGEDYKIYEVSDFVNSGKIYKDAIGIVFGTPIIGTRVLAFDCWIKQWGKPDKMLTEPCNESQAVQVLCGLDNTERIVKAQKDFKKLTAAKWCWEYEKGGFRWYLPSLMELGALFLLRDQVNDAMMRVGCGDCMLPTKNSNTKYVWSSSESSLYDSWNVNFSNGYFSGNLKDGIGVVRAIAVLSHPLQSNSFPDDVTMHSEMTDEELINQLRDRRYKGQLTKTIQL